jgi:hypothetical protein
VRVDSSSERTESADLAWPRSASESASIEVVTEFASALAGVGCVLIGATAINAIIRFRSPPGPSTWDSFDLRHRWRGAIQLGFVLIALGIAVGIVGAVLG